VPALHEAAHPKLPPCPTRGEYVASTYQEAD
jgi:hypothetical protein